MTRINETRQSKTAAKKLITGMAHMDRNKLYRDDPENAALLFPVDGDSSGDESYIPSSDDESADEYSGSESDEGDGAESVSGDDEAVGLLQDDEEPSDVDMGGPPSFPYGGFDGMVVG